MDKADGEEEAVDVDEVDSKEDTEDVDEAQGEEETDGEEEAEYDEAECEDAKELEGVLCSLAVRAAC